jgi:hypothetical protein
MALRPRYASVREFDGGDIREITVGEMTCDQACFCRPVICDFVASQGVNLSFKYGHIFMTYVGRTSESSTTFPL